MREGELYGAIRLRKQRVNSRKEVAPIALTCARVFPIDPTNPHRWRLALDVCPKFLL
jgi:hypothetical protein